MPRKVVHNTKTDMKKVLFLACVLLTAVTMQAATVSFTSAEWASSQSLIDGATVTSYTQDGVTVTFSEGNAVTWNESQSAVAAVSGNKMAIAAPEGYEVTTASFTMYREAQATNLASATWSAGNASANSTQVTWTGNAQSVTVEINNTARFVSFSITVAEAATPEPPEDESVYNDTTVFSIATWIDDEGFSDGETFDHELYSNAGKTMTVDKGTGSQPGFGSNCLTFKQGNTLTLTSPYMMHKIVLHFNGETDATTFLEGRELGYKTYPAATCSTGKFKADEVDNKNVIWTGSTAQLIISGGYTVKLMGLTVISDKTASQATVIFLGLNGEELDRQNVSFGSAATAPTLPVSDKLGMVVHWDTDFSQVYNDLTVRAVEEPIVNLNLTPLQCRDLRKEIANGVSFTSGNATIELTGGRAVDATSWAESEGKVVVFAGNTIGVTSSDIFRQVRFSCLDATVAGRMATAVCSSGNLYLHGNIVTWKGETNTLTITAPNWETGITRLEVYSMPAPILVTFLDRDGNVLKEDTVQSGAAAVAPEPPVVTGYNFTGWSVDFSNVTDDITTQTQYVLRDDYALVTFTDLYGKVMETQAVHKGDNAVAPMAPTLTCHTFTGWDHPLTNITEDVTIQPVYEFDVNSPDIMSMEEWIEAFEHRYDETGLKEGKSYAVRGILYELREIGLESDGKLSFSLTTDGNGQDTRLDAIRMLDPNREPFYSTEQLVKYDTVIVYGTFEHIYIQSESTMRDYTGLTNGYTPYIGRVHSDDNLVYILMPHAEAMYDFSANGLKQAPLVARNSQSESVYDAEQGYTTTQYTTDITLQLSADITERFKPQELFGTSHYEFRYGGVDLGDATVAYIEDVNDDGRVDISTIGAGIFVKTDDGCERIESLTSTNMDINHDGRIDHLVLDRSVNVTTGGAKYGQIAYQLADGNFRYEPMVVMTWDEFVEQMTPEERDQYENPQNYSLGEVSRYTYTAQLGGASLARAPKHNKAKKATDIGQLISAPTKAIDMNKDGLIDLIDENNGIIYTNMDNGKWVWTQTNGLVVPADLNGDGITDFIFPGEKLSVAIYDKSSKTINLTVLYQNAAVDDLPYCLDFDKDGDIDILATFSYVRNTTGVAYSCFFINDGKGNFTRQSEQNYGDNKLWFSQCQDLDGDGIYDLLAIRGEITSVGGGSILGGAYGASDACYDAAEIVWLRGNANKTFGAPQKIYDLEWGEGPIKLWTGRSGSVGRGKMELRVNAEDLDGDGKMEIWASGQQLTWIGGSLKKATQIYSMEDATPNVRPSAPAKPTLEYKEGVLTVTWGDGSDDKTATKDLTYALRIGTTAGGNQILAAHVNADGSRRNFLDGNMGREHSYTIDLRTYAPSEIYVAVQTIDAQHAGSAWSAEATTTHETIPVEIFLSQTTINFNEYVEVYYTALPEGYKHQWSYGDGQLLKDATFLRLAFPTPGTKTITHTVTSPGNKSVTASATLEVLPAGVGEGMGFEEYKLYEFNNIVNAPMADYTFDGRLDGFCTQNKTMVVNGVATDELFTQAIGLWNTNISCNAENFWYDWDRNGQVDLIFKSYAAMLHDDEALTACADDENLVYMFDYYRDGSGSNYFSGYTLKRDLVHNGLYDNIMQNPYEHSQIIELDEKGDPTWTQFTVEGDADLFQLVLNNKGYIRTADFDRDGWMDIAALVRHSNGSYDNALSLFLNRGNGHFVQHSIPLNLPSYNEWGLQPQVADFNGDGYQDLILLQEYNENDHNKYLLLNNANNGYAAPVVLPNSGNTNTNDPLLIADIDNNGYPDLLGVVKNPAAGEDRVGVYVWYFGAEGLLTHGFIMPDVSDYNASPQVVFFAENDLRLYVANQLYPIVAQVDERPAAPTGLKATLTDDGLLIEWNAAVDDHTPAELMRYNLAVKQQGASTYLISPQNGGHAEAAYLPGYDYVEATQYLIPTKYLNAGNYEIALQALDQQNKLSPFTETLVAAVVRNPIEIPSSSCADQEVTVSYRGAETTGTPVWNFDGGIAEGYGFGPYTVIWTTGGEKTVTLTLNGQTSSATITIDDPKTLSVTMPTVLYEGTPASASVPEGVTYAWYALIGDNAEAYPIDATGVLLPATSIFVSYDKRLTASGLNVTAHKLAGNDGTLVGTDVTLYLEITNATGCTTRFEQPVTVMAATNIPTLTLVTTDANGHNVVSWTNADAFESVNIYKEGSTLNDFQLLGSAAAVEGSFTDSHSDATQKAERYRLTGVTDSGDESPESAIHKTVHLTINRGVQNGTFNLIWNEYVGADVTSYNILRGATPTSLSQIATLASSNTSYTDQAPVDAQPYYAIEYVLSAASNAPAKAKTNANAALSGRSNVVDRRNAEEGIEDVQSDNGQCTKVIRDGQIYILRGDKIYTLTGVEVR